LKKDSGGTSELQNFSVSEPQNFGDLSTSELQNFGDLSSLEPQRLKKLETMNIWAHPWNLCNYIKVSVG
jgi:hypothetical protein